MLQGATSIAIFTNLCGIDGSIGMANRNRFPAFEYLTPIADTISPNLFTGGVHLFDKRVVDHVIPFMRKHKLA